MNSKFSDFFRLATYEEKERVWKEIARKSCEDQQEIINKANQMSALNEKKVAYIKKGKVYLTSAPPELPPLLRVWGPCWFRNKGIRLDEYQLREISLEDYDLVTDQVGFELTEAMVDGYNVELEKAYYYCRRIPIKT